MYLIKKLSAKPRPYFRTGMYFNGHAAGGAVG
jgi:hypothetical protein